MDDKYRFMRDLAFFIGGMLFIIFFGGCARAPAATVGRAMPHYLPHQGIAFQYPMRLLTRDEKGITWLDC